MYRNGPALMLTVCGYLLLWVQRWAGTYSNCLSVLNVGTEMGLAAP